MAGVSSEFDHNFHLGEGLYKMSRVEASFNSNRLGLSQPKMKERAEIEITM